MEYRSPVCKARICRKSPLMFQHPSFILARRNNRHHFRVSSRVMPMPPGYTKVFGFAPTWCTTKYLARSCGVFFIAVFRKSRSLVRHRGREELVYFRLSKKRLLGRALLARARLSVKQLPKKTRCCAKSAGDQWSPLHIQQGKNVIF